MLGVYIHAFVCAYGFKVSNLRVMVGLLVLLFHASKERYRVSYYKEK